LSTATTALRGERSISQLLFNPISMGLAAVVLLISALLPTAGLGFDLCWFKVTSGLPCPGCGLTRSLTNVSHLELGTALRYHPFGIVIWLLAAFLAGAGLAGERRRRAIRRFLVRHDAIAQRAYWGFVYAFVAFGVLRLAGAVVVPGWFEQL
jgi:hypothetical protein